MADPFGSLPYVRHPALCEEYKLPADFYYPLVEDFLQDEKYTRWAEGYRPWQLHCTGAPGCGKTTFAAVVVQELKKRYQGNTEVRIASIFLRERVTHEHATFVEDFLACVYSQICSNSEESDTTARTPSIPHAYENACHSGEAYATRLDILRSELRTLLKSTEHNFLVLDGFDQLDAASRMLLEHELRESHVHNLSLMVTRRVPLFEKPQERARCDGCVKDPIFLYWECSECPPFEQDFCYECKENGVLCAEGHDISVLAEPYNRIELDISRVPLHMISRDEGFIDPVLNYVVRELNTGLGLGDESSQVVDKAAASIVEKAKANVNNAKLRVEDLLATDIGETFGKVGDRLPRNIVAFFDAEMARIESQTSPLRELALLAIVAVAEHEYHQGVLVETLERLTRRARTESPHLKLHPIRSLEDILDAANGLIELRPEIDVFGVVFYHGDFATYAKENYNETLFLMKARLDRSMPKAEEALEYYPQRVLSSPNILSEPFQSLEDEDYASDRDSAYFSGNTSRQTSTDSDLPTLQTLKPAAIAWNDAEVVAEGHESTVTSTELGTKPESPDNTSQGPRDGEPRSLCSFCENNIIRGPSTKGLHHNSLASLAESAAEHCLFCSDLYEDILQSFPVADLDAHTTVGAPEWPLCSWVIRSTGKVRNSKTSFAITFRFVGAKDNVPTATQKSKTYRILAEADIGIIPRPEELGKSTDPSQSGGMQLKEWMNKCRNTHPNCYRRKEGQFVPTRLVDLQCEDQDMVKIVDTKKNGIKSRYCTLSHSWGTSIFLQLKVENQAELMGPGVKVSRLSKNFQQAISAARFMGERYIWIDSLCIRQGKGGDFIEQGQLMHLVYSYSFCNIAIADSSDGEGGLFRDRNPSDILPACYESDGTGKLAKGTWRVLREDLWSTDLLGTKIYTRGWVFQERMLSPRIVHFAASQIFWDCSAISACEALPNGLPHELDDIASTDRHWRGRIQATSDDAGAQPLVGANDGSMRQFWKSALLNYTSCNLTSQGDKTIAIWSIAKIVRDELVREDKAEDYGAGFWKRALEEQLAWRMKDAGVLESRIPELQVTNPSWSWASVKGAVLAHDRLTTWRFYTATSLDGVSPIALPIAPYSNRNVEPGLIDGSLSMSGYMGRGRVHSTKPGQFEMAVMNSKGEADLASPSEYPTCVFEVFPDELWPTGRAHQEPIFEFIILAASIIQPGGFALPGVDEDSADADSVTISGTALLLTPHSTYKAQEYAKYGQIVRKNPEEREADPPYGMDKSLVQKTAAMLDIAKMLEAKEQRVDAQISIERWYRRIGVLKFHGLSVGMWKGLKKDGRVGILLD